MKKIISMIFLLLLSFIFMSCQEPSTNEDVYYNVTFIINRDTKEEIVVKVKENTTVEKPTNPIIADREFVGWTLDNELYDFNSLVTKDIELVAVFNDFFKVTFVVDNEETIIVVKENTKVEKPVDPIKGLYDFIGWYLNDELYDFDSLVTKDIKLVAVFDETNPMLEISVDTNELYFGYSTQINSIFYNTDEVDLNYESSEEGIVYIGANGVITAIRPGKVKVRANANGLISNEIEIEVLEEEINEEDKIDLKGYTIYHNDALFYNKTELKLNNSDEAQLRYQLILEIERKYNCKFERLDFNFEKDKVFEVVFHSNYTGKDLTALIDKYDDRYPGFFDESQYVFGVNGDEISCLGASRGLTYTQGFFYDKELIKSVGLKDPLDIYLEGKWTYSNFVNWCEEAKKLLDANPVADKYGNKTYVVYQTLTTMYYGMMTTIGKRLIDPLTHKNNVLSDESKAIKKIINDLENQEIITDKTTDCLLIAADDMFPYNFRVGGVDDVIHSHIANPSFVPYPYPDDYDPNNVYFEENFTSVAFADSDYIVYPEGVEFEEIYVVVMDLLYSLQMIGKYYSKGIFGFNFIYELDERAVDLLNNIPQDKLLYNGDFGILPNYASCFLNDSEFNYQTKLNELLKKKNIE